ncbi:MAG: hypothetical protein IJW48_02860 [Clostridia bacterium]|nr:hypothetical protein [Clostridia bacterium]
MSGKPCLAEEIGTMGPMLASNDMAADITVTSSEYELTRVYYGSDKCVAPFDVSILLYEKK